MCGLFFLNAELEHKATKSAIWHLRWLQGQIELHRAVFFLQFFKRKHKKNLKIIGTKI